MTEPRVKSFLCKKIKSIVVKVFQLCAWTDKQTYNKQTQMYALPSHSAQGATVIINNNTSKQIRLQGRIQVEGA